MFNLSDKELDRLSREASQEFDPGDVLGPRSWERLEPQLHKELGGTSPNPFRGFRRSPFFYVPAILLVAGVFYFVKQSHRSNQTQTSGSPPTDQASTRPAVTTEPISSTKDPDHSSNSTPPVTTPSVSTPSASTSTAVTTPAAPTPATTNPGSAAAGSTAANPTTASTNPATAGSASVRPTTVPYPDATTRTHSNRRNNINNSTLNKNGRQMAAISNNKYTPSNKPGRRGKNHLSAGANPNPNNLETLADASTTGANHNNPGTNASTGANHSTGANTAPHELTLSTIHISRPARQHPAINDSALRAYTAKSTTSPISPAKSKSLHINKSLQFGLSLAPDFSSVNSLAGDKPGSTIGFTLDYQFTNRWYLSTGLFLDRKNYAARAQDYHVPYDYYRANNLHNVNFVKGSFNMIEIPLNLRYDFSVTGNTLFFASAGASSYLMANENCNYYFDSFGRENCMTFNYNNRKSFLFSSVNLSLGVETGISNNLSIVVAPYVKIPSRNIGFGQIQMNSVGINFALKFAPTISRRRK